MTEGKILDNKSEALDTWAYVEIMGHSKIAGRLSERKVGVNVMIQVDVPKGETEFSHSQLFSPASLFSITPTTEQWCREFAAARERMDYEPPPYIPTQRQLPSTSQEELFDGPEEL